jgi:hypothetical protein
MCTAQIGERMRAARNPVLSSGGYEGGGSFTSKAMTVPGARSKRISKVPLVPLLGAPVPEDQAT